MKNAWDQIAQYRHQQLLAGEDHTFTDVLLPQLIEILNTLGNTSKLNVLDIGCSTGFLTEILSHKVNRIVGIDPSKKSIAIAQDHVKSAKNALVECISIENFSLKHTEEFDLALAHMTMHAIENLENALSAISIVLKPSRWFIFSVPHPCFWSSIKSSISEDGFQYHTTSTHTNTFSFSNDLEIEVPYHHRSLDNYCSSLKLNGFTVLDIYEPFPSEIVMKKYHRKWFYPGFMFILCKKQKEG